MMTKRCPFCAEEIQYDAVKCRFCGEFLDGRQPTGMSMGGPMGGPIGPQMFMGRIYGGYEYKSSLNILGIPLIHIAQGYDPRTGRPRVAKGIIAIGNIALGLFALGGIAVGGVALGGLALGLLVLGGLAIGAVAVGGVAVALYFALGGMALSLMYAIGGMAIAPHSLSGAGADPEMLQWLERWFPGISDAFPSRRR